MLTATRGLRALLAALVLSSGLVLVAAATAGATNLGDASNSMGNQTWADTSAASKGSGYQPAGWDDMANGAGAGRPFVTELSVNNGGTVHTYLTGGTRDSLNVASAVGDLTATISPTNLCAQGQSGGCYSTPNRIAVSLGYTTGTDPNSQIGLDFAGHPGISGFNDGVTIDSGTTIDMTINLGALGQNLRWTWVNGNVQNVKTAGLGTSSGTIRLQFKPVHTPNVTPYPQSANGCSATPLFDCVIHQATQDYLSANLVLSVDNTMDAALTGAVFSTQSATFGYLDPGQAGNASLSIQAGGPNLLADGSANSATVSAFFPESAVLSIYGMTSTDAAPSVGITAAGDTTIGTKSVTAIPAGDSQDQGMAVTITGVTFPDTPGHTQAGAPRRSTTDKTPTFKVKSNATNVSGSAQVSGTKTNLSVASVPKCPTSAGCKALVFDLGPKTTKRSKVTATLRTAAAGVAVTNSKFTWSVASSKLAKNHAYVVEFKKGTKILSVARGNVG